jgi:hypothetical protein
VDLYEEKQLYTGLIWTRSAFVIYMVKVNFDDAAREAAWNAWYETFQ